MSYAFVSFSDELLCAVRQIAAGSPETSMLAPEEVLLFEGAARCFASEFVRAGLVYPPPAVSLGAVRAITAEVAMDVVREWRRDFKAGRLEVVDESGAVAGACSDIAHAVAEALDARMGLNAAPIAAQTAEIHWSVVVSLADGAYVIDLPWGCYEENRGCGYVPKKTFSFDADSVVVTKICDEPLLATEALMRSY